MNSKRSNGFTLIEVLAVTALSAVIMGGFLLFGAQILERWRVDAERRRTTTDVEFTLKSLHEDLAARHWEMDGRPWLQVEADRLRFFTTLHATDVPELREVHYYFSEGKLMRQTSSAEHTWKLLSDPELHPLDPPVESVATEVLIENVQHAAFTLEARAVRVLLEVERTGEVFSCEVRLPASADAGR